MLSQTHHRALLLTALFAHALSASRIFAVYVMPDDDTSDDAQRLIETDIAQARRRAIGFVEFGYNGRWSNEGVPLAQKIALHCLEAGRW